MRLGPSVAHYVNIESGVHWRVLSRCMHCFFNDQNKISLTSYFARSALQSAFCNYKVWMTLRDYFALRGFRALIFWMISSKLIELVILRLGPSKAHFVNMEPGCHWEFISRFETFSITLSGHGVLVRWRNHFFRILKRIFLCFPRISSLKGKKFKS